MKRTILLFALTLVSYSLVAQMGRHQNREKIKSARIAWITSQIELTPNQAEKFWPMYNEYIEKRTQVHKSYRMKRRTINIDSASEAEKYQIIELEFEKKQAVIDLEKDYSKKLLAVISTEQLLSLRRAEGEFRKMLLNKLRDRQENRKQLRRNLQDIQDSQ